jgi:hypothetical protein
MPAPGTPWPPAWPQPERRRARSSTPPGCQPLAAPVTEGHDLCACMPAGMRENNAKTAPSMASMITDCTGVSELFQLKVRQYTCCWPPRMCTRKHTEAPHRLEAPACSMRDTAQTGGPDLHNGRHRSMHQAAHCEAVQVLHKVRHLPSERLGCLETPAVRVSVGGFAALGAHAVRLLEGCFCPAYLVQTGAMLSEGRQHAFYTSAMN